MGWADAVKVLMKAYLEGGFMPKFDFRAIRKKGARLVTAGGKAPGPEPLKVALFHIQNRVIFLLKTYRTEYFRPKMTKAIGLVLQLEIIF